jgi:protein-tyrosine phosphatase
MTDQRNDDRHVQLDGCFNFRDLGGYETPDGRRVLTRALFRADGPHALTDGDAATLHALGLATLIDLRTREEVETRGTYRTVLSDVDAHHFPLIDVLPDTDELPTWIDPDDVAVRYRAMLDDATNAIAQLLALLSERVTYPAMFHCSAGKDRTGIVAGIVLGLLGVPDDVIVADYALSAAAMHQLVAHYHAQYPAATERLNQVAPAMVTADPQTMVGLIAGLRADFGSLEGYARAIGVPDAPQRLRDVLLVQG